MQFMDEQQHDGDADQDVAPVLQPNVPPGAGMVALQAHMHANLDAGPGAAAPIVLAGGPQPLYIQALRHMSRLRRSERRMVFTGLPLPVV